MTLLRLLVIFVCVAISYGFVTEYDENDPIYDEGYAVDQEDQYESRIIGGKPAEIEDYPHQCSFIGNESFFCGCIIISDRYILTAAHCAGVEPEQVALRVGSTYRTNGTLVPIEEVIRHETYDDPPFDKDIAVFKTAVPIEFNERVKHIALPESGREMVGGSTFTVAGWGRTMHGAPTIPERLMAVNLTTTRRSMCSMSYSGVFTDNMFCGGRFWLGGKGVCQGDSGGAAIQDGKVVGIVSFGRFCGQPMAPSVFTDVASPDMREFVKNCTGI